MEINNVFEHEQIVFLKTDPDQFERMVTRIIIPMSGGLLYELSCGNETSLHYEGEISAAPNMIKVLGLENKYHG